MNDFSCTLFNAQSGALSAKLECEDGTTLHVHSLVDPEREYEYYSNLSFWGDYIILVGSGLGYHLSGCLVKNEHIKKIIVIEYYSEFAQHCAQLIEDKYGEKPYVITSDSPDVCKNLIHILSDKSNIQLVKQPVSYRVNKKFYDDILESVLLTKRDQKSCSTWITSILQGSFFLQKELDNATRKNSDIPISFNYTNLNDSIEYEQKLQQVIAENHPNIFISINMLGFDGNGIFSEYTLRNDIQVVVWFVDDPRPILLSQQQFITKNMVAFCWERSYFIDLKNAGFKSVHYLPLATDPDLFCKMTGNKRSIELGFTGTSMAGEFRRSLLSKFLWNKSLDPIAINIAKKLIENRSLDIDESLRDYCKLNNLQIPFEDTRNSVWLRSYIIHTAGMLQRKRLVDSLKEFGIQTFGDNRGWKELCGDNFKRNPDVDYQTELADVYRSTLININSTSCQMQTAVNQRVFDVPACGSFLINDYQQDLDDLFRPDEIVVYHSLDELKSLINYYIKHDNERETLITRAHKKIVDQHTYAHRYAEIKNVMCAQ